MAVASVYPTYCNSGLAWIPKLPEGWQVLRNGRLFGHRVEMGFPDLPILEVSLRTGVRVRDMENLKRKQAISQKEKYKRATKGDIAYNMMRMWQGAVGPAPVDGLVSPAYVVVKPYAEANSTYYSYLFRTAAYMQEVNKYSRGIVADRNRLYWESFKQMPSLVPPRPEQDQIVAYLRAQDVHIARFIKAKRDLIKLLTEQKLRIIDHAVTRGLDASVALKPSGIEWLGPVPEHWQIHRVKEISHVVMGQSPLSSDCNHQGVGLPFLQGCAEFGATVPKPVQFCPTASKKAPINSILMSVRAPVGKMNMADQMYGIGRGLCSVAPKNAVWLTDFARFALESGAGQLKYLTTGSTFDAVSKADVRNMTICLPPVAEQERIARYLFIETKNVDDTIQKAGDEILLIREYRDRLITDVVTGQVDVRGWQPGPEDVVEDAVLAALGDDQEEMTEQEDDDDED
ncbi:restriction endonuclease subunit S [Xylella fastidiosa]|uniref:restriction endonuclease subunit S n=1 Tax=Xylella fastidiosa TaxID=2371 RepID=UPI0011230EDD|nr:restriction endonuclease subunit S [Xylella fastidiosa]MDD0942631.1 restriction endonuclease subunit S [Xylella fastidiosa subsp. multiplex]QTX29937.1 restriction endonuclease subunit S [Xylella fastidiosa subsp. multiplex]TNV97025.1 restriction endonuclease subunit S [Xylella fastidiosa]